MKSTFFKTTYVIGVMIVSAMSFQALAGDFVSSHLNPDGSETFLHPYFPSPANPSVQLPINSWVMPDDPLAFGSPNLNGALCAYVGKQQFVALGVQKNELGQNITFPETAVLDPHGQFKNILQPYGHRWYVNYNYGIDWLICR